MIVRETFEYEVDTDDIEEVFTISSYVQCVDDMTSPFWDGMIAPDIINHNLEIIEQ